VAAEAYNDERALLQAAVVIGVGLALGIERLRDRWSRPVGLIAGAAVVVTLAWTSGLVTQASLTGAEGEFVAARRVNLSVGGEDHERFVVGPHEVAAVEWLDREAPPRALVFTDRYGRLRVIGGTSRSDGVVDGLSPATIDRRAYVFATTANVEGRARGSLGLELATYQFPRRFLEAHKSVVYSNGLAEVFK